MMVELMIKRLKGNETLLIYTGLLAACIAFGIPLNRLSGLVVLSEAEDRFWLAVLEDYLLGFLGSIRAG